MSKEGYMKRIIMLAIILCVALSGCVKPDNAINTGNTDEATTASQPSEQLNILPSGSPIEEQAEPSEPQVGSLLYADPEIDLFVMVKSPDWVYTKQLYEGEAYFYPKDENPVSSPNGFAISSQELPDASIDKIWSETADTLKSQLKDFEWQSEDPIDIGDYTGYRYHFTGSGIFGDYLYWETDKLLYICSFTSNEDVYETNFAILADSLNTFKVLNDMKTE